MHMQGAQYAYKIPYTDMDAFYLLEKSEGGGRCAFVISLKKPIRQGNQKYQNLVIETHSVETTVSVNLSQQEIDEKYEGKLSPEMTMPMATLIGKLFKVITNVKVFMPKQFLSAKGIHCIRCSIKANEGLLYPLAKSFIFIHKPTVIIQYEHIEIVEFYRYEPVANSGELKAIVFLYFMFF
jgi:structure-specific recognition protein 1